jgi:hypothetical protein
MLNNTFKVERQKFEPLKDKNSHPDLIGFQMVNFSFDFYGIPEEFTLDTKITKEGKQIVTGNNGWIKSGQDITNWK